MNALGEEAMRIKGVAEALEVSRDTIRRWERLGLIKPARDWAGHRRFTTADVAAMRQLVTGGPLPSRGTGENGDCDSGHGGTR